MNHLLVLPVLLPALAAAAIVLGCRRAGRLGAKLSVLASLAGLAVSVLLLRTVMEGAIPVYALGGWVAPHGIVLVADRLSALMLVLTWSLGVVVAIAALGHDEARGVNYHALVQLELMGVSGAFLTGDLFNLFVCFEILLAASYGLLVQGGGRDRIVSALHYVVLNLVGSCVFLLALGIVYASAGTLNIADLATRIPDLDGGARTLLEIAAGMLIVVFGLKAAIVPIHAWLPSAYGVALGPVAALFAIMTKVGVYAIVRVFGTGFGGRVGAGAGEGLGTIFLDATFFLGGLTIVSGAIGALGSRDLRRLVAHLVVVSVGTLLIAVGQFDIAALGAALFYAVHSTFATAGLFLVVELVARGRREEGARLVVGRPLTGSGRIGVLYGLLAVAAAGLPPLAGFLGKVSILRAGVDTDHWFFLFTAVLGSSFLTLVALSRSGSLIFWRAAGERYGVQPSRPVVLASGLLIGVSVLLVIFADPVLGFTEEAAREIVDPTRYLRAVLGGAP